MSEESPTSEPSHQNNKEWDWDALYAGLEVLASKLNVKWGDTLDDFDIALRASREVENRATIYFTRISKHLAKAKDNLRSAKFVLKLATKSLLIDQEFLKHKKESERKIYADVALLEESQNLEVYQDLVNNLTCYRDTLDKILSSAKHFREDIGRRIKLIDIKREIS